MNLIISDLLNETYIIIIDYYSIKTYMQSWTVVHSQLGVVQIKKIIIIEHITTGRNECKNCNVSCCITNYNKSRKNNYVNLNRWGQTSRTSFQEPAQCKYCIVILITWKRLAARTTTKKNYRLGYKLLVIQTWWRIQCSKILVLLWHTDTVQEWWNTW